MKRAWRHDRLGRSLTRTTGADGLVTVRQGDGGTTVTVRRAAQLHPSSSAVVFMIVHTRTFG